MSLREDLEKAFEVLYDYEYIDIEKFYNDKSNYELLLEFDKGDDEVLEELRDELQSFLNFETNYNLTIGDLVV